MPTCGQLLAQEGARLLDVVLALDPLLADELLDLLVLARMEHLEGEVLELPLDRVDSQAMRERRVDLERLARLAELLLLRHRPERPHVVEAVGELDQDDPHVRGHRDHHLPVVLGLALVPALERDAGQLRHPVDEMGDRLAEALLDLLEARARVLDGVVQERGAEGLGVEAQTGADLRHLDRVVDELLAGAAALVGVALAGEGERPLDLTVVHGVPVAGVDARRSPPADRRAARARERSATS